MDTAASESGPLQTAKAAAELLSCGDFIALRELLDPEVVWFANGDPDHPGVYRGRDAVIAALRVQRAEGEIETVDVVETEEPEVEAFAFAPRTGQTSYYSVQAVAEHQKCERTTSILQVQGPVITSFGSMPAPRAF